ncbi:MAG: heme ABC transporter ATP-binding protein CcmA [Gammaproteobacteria bacterium]|nr:MAG: heme ABC transporter ATP-binding protein CcmA [Gammaproteobacteria bacterium]
MLLGSARRQSTTVEIRTLSDLLSGNELCLLRGDRCLFTDLNFALSAGELLLVEGINGSGKTSLLRGIAGMLDFEDGNVDWHGIAVTKDYQAFRSDLVWLAHKVGFKADLTLLENLRFESGLRNTSMQNLGGVLERLGLARLTGLPLRVLSAGQQRRVALARMLLADAKLWLMDEPFSNLDSAGQALVVELIAEHLAVGGLCVVASHQGIDLDAPIRRITLQ